MEEEEEELCPFTGAKAFVFFVGLVEEGFMKMIEEEDEDKRLVVRERRKGKERNPLTEALAQARVVLVFLALALLLSTADVKLKAEAKCVVPSPLR